MGLFSKGNKNAALMAISFGYDGLYSASLRHEFSSLPVLESLSFYPKSNQTWATLLERLARETQAKLKQCCYLASPNDYQLCAIDGMNVPEDELKSAMRWRLKEMIDFPVEEATVDVLHVPGDQNAGGRNQFLIAVVARNQKIQETQALFLNAKLLLSVIDIPEMAQRNISALIEPSGRGLAMLSFDAGGGLLTVTFGGELYLSRRLDVSLAQLADENEDDQKMMFERVSLELQRSLDNFDRQHHYITTAKLVLSPLGDVAEKLKEFLTANMYLPVEILNLEAIINLTQVPELKDAQKQQQFFSVIGAAMRRTEGAV